MSVKGVLFYLVAGDGGGRSGQHAIQFPVALMTLRAWWAGPVHVVCGDSFAYEILGEISKGYHGTGTLTYSHEPKPDGVRCYGMKANLAVWSPFEKSAFLDTDTVVVGDFAPVFPLDGESMVFTSFSDWRANSRRMWGRLKKWSDKFPTLVNCAAARKDLPAINTGVMGIPRNSVFTRPWQAMCKAKPNEFIADETAANLLLASVSSCRVIDDRYNLSPKLGLHTEDPRIWHGHGRKFLVHPKGQAIWLPFARECIESNFGNIRAWGGRYKQHCASLAAENPELSALLQSI